MSINQLVSDSRAVWFTVAGHASAPDPDMQWCFDRWPHNSRWDFDQLLAIESPAIGDLTAVLKACFHIETVERAYLDTSHHPALVIAFQLNSVDNYYLSQARLAIMLRKTLPPTTKITGFTSHPYTDTRTYDSF